MVDLAQDKPRTKFDITPRCEPYIHKSFEKCFILAHYFSGKIFMAEWDSRLTVISDPSFGRGS